MCTNALCLLSNTKHISSMRMYMTFALHYF